MNASSAPPAVLIGALVIAIPFIVYCWNDIIKSDGVRYLPKWLWIILCCNLVGCVAYLLFGKEK